MAYYHEDLYVEGATDKESELLEMFKSERVMRQAKLTKHLYYKFYRGEKVPPFVRHNMEEFLKTFSDEIKSIYKD